MSALLSVVMPTYNGEKYIGAALESVQQQHDEDIELILVDDGSSDGTIDIIRSFAGNLRTKLITPGRTGNWVTATNVGLREASGDWVCFLHQDDLWLPGRIAKLRSETQNAQGALIVHNSVFVGPDGQKLGPWTCPLKEGDVAPEEFVERLLIQNFIAIPAPLFRRVPIIESGSLDENLWFSADWDLWLRLGALGPVRFIDETLTAFRVHPTSQTSSRTTEPLEWDYQLGTVFTRHFTEWAGSGSRRKSVKSAAALSILVNSRLAAASRGEPYRLGMPLVKFVTLGPAGWYRYFRDSRIIQRVRSRLKVRGFAAP